MQALARPHHRTRSRNWNIRRAAGTGGVLLVIAALVLLGSADAGPVGPVAQTTADNFVTLPPSAPTATFTGMAGGLKRFTVAAHRYYFDAIANSRPVGVIRSNAPNAAPPGRTCYLIDVNLTTATMVASRCGVVFIQSLITSGRPGFRSPTGTWYTSRKLSNVIFRSPYPVPGTPGYYPPTFVKYAIQYNWPYYLHTWPEPLSAFGPGSENGPYASLGCIEMPDAVMAALFAWAPTGTAVHIHY